MPAAAESTEAHNIEDKAIYHDADESQSECAIQSELLCIYRLDLSLKFVNSQCYLHFGKIPDELKDKSFLLFVLKKTETFFSRNYQNLALKFLF